MANQKVTHYEGNYRATPGGPVSSLCRRFDHEGFVPEGTKATCQACLKLAGEDGKKFTASKEQVGYLIAYLQTCGEVRIEKYDDERIRLVLPDEIVNRILEGEAAKVKA